MIMLFDSVQKEEKEDEIIYERGTNYFYKIHPIKKTVNDDKIVWKKWKKYLKKLKKKKTKISSKIKSEKAITQLTGERKIININSENSDNNVQAKGK